MSIFSVTWTDIKIMLKTPKLYLILFFVWFFMNDYAKQVITIAEIENLGVAPFLYPLIMSDWYRNYLVIVMIMFMADVPFKNDANLYTMIRCGRRNWLISKIVTIISVSVIYQVICYLISVLILGTNLGLSTKWGDCLRMLGMANSEAMAIGNAQAVSEVIANYEPLAALFYTMVLAILLQMAVGFFIFFVNGLTKSSWGIILTLGVALLDIFLSALRSFGGMNVISGIMSCVDLSQIYTTEYAEGKKEMVVVIFVLVAVNVILISLLNKFVELRLIEIEE